MAVISPIIIMCLLLYFLYHTMNGERGFFSWVRLQQKVAEDEKVLDELQQKKESLERQVQLLRPDSLDLDMLEERSRAVLNFVDKDEIVIRSYK